MFKKNSTWKLEPSSDVDVVLVSSEGPGMKHVVHRLPILVDHLDSFMKNHKISPRFGLVGFSGKAPVHRPGHVHTVKGKFFSDAKDFKDSVIMNMQFAKRCECFAELIECFHMTSRRPYWCPKTMKRRPCWCPNQSSGSSTLF